MRAHPIASLTKATGKNCFLAPTLAIFLTAWVPLIIRSASERNDRSVSSFPSQVSYPEPFRNRCSGHPTTKVLTARRAQIEDVAGATGLEPAASCVTGRRSNQLNYAPACDTLLLCLLISPGSLSRPPVPCRPI